MGDLTSAASGMADAVTSVFQCEMEDTACAPMECLSIQADNVLKDRVDNFRPYFADYSDQHTGLAQIGVSYRLYLFLKTYIFYNINISYEHRPHKQSV